MTISNHIEKLKEELQRDAFPSEAAVTNGVLLPALNELGWPVFDTGIVVPEFSLEGRRVDYALCHPMKKPAIFVEVKKGGNLEGADKQLFEYAFHSGVPMAILTDGKEWRFYLPGEQGRYDERMVYKLDLLERNIEDAANKLERYLRYEKVCSGEALQAARSDYQAVAKDREIKDTLPRAWNALLKEPDSLLLEYLAEKVADLCGYKPDLNSCGQFLESVSKPTIGKTVSPPKQAIRLSVEEPPKQTTRLSVEEPKRLDGVHKRSVVSYVFRGRTYEYKSAKELMCKVFQLLIKEDADFPERFLALKHGKKRRYLAQDRRELYPGLTLEFVEKKSIEVAPGWWLATNFSRGDIQEILNKALAVVHPRVRSQIQVNM